MRNLEAEISEGDLLFTDVRAAMERLAEAQQHQERLQGELKQFPRESRHGPHGHEHVHVKS